MIRENSSMINRKRIFFLFILFMMVFLAIIYKLITIQYIYADKYKSYADYQHKDEFIINSKRGKILDRNGIELAVSLVERTIYANPKFVTDPDSEAKILSEILSLNQESVREKLSKEDLGFVYIKRKVDAEKAEMISDLGLPGIYVKNETKRYYPQNELAASIIGFTGLDNIGLSGIELQYEKYLRGVDGKIIAETDVFGKIIPYNENTYIKPIDGSDIILTIDSQIQYVVEKKLEEVVLKFDALRAIAIVMDPVSGQIYAMAGYPGFDLNNYQNYDYDVYKALGISYTYEPGSTFKIVDVISALNSNSLESSTVFNLPPNIKVGDRTIKEIFRTYNIDYSVKEIIQHSSNIGAVTIALQMGKKLFWENIRELGFGELTEIDMPGEEKGIVYDYNSWPASAIGAIAIGQNISVTPIQLLRAVCTAANGGYLVSPKIVTEIKLNSNEVELLEFGEGRKVIRDDVAEEVKKMMLAVVEEGTGKHAQIEGIEVCGKTGTAEKANKSGVGYDEGRTITSFVGFAPYQNPKVAIIVVVDEPKGGDGEIWGGTVAAPIFRDIMEFSLSRLKFSGELF